MSIATSFGQFDRNVSYGLAVEGGDVTVSNVSVVSGTTLTADLMIAPGAATGDRTITVTTPVGTSATATFTVYSVPTLTAIAPASGKRGSTVTVTLTGAEFVHGATTVAVDGAGVAVSNVSVTSDSMLTADLTIAHGTEIGLRTVTVTTPGGASAGVGFSVELNTLTFVYTGERQNFTVPAGVMLVIIQAYGAQGGAGDRTGGLGAW